MAQYTIKSAHLAKPKNDQKVSKILPSIANKISNMLPHINTNRWRIVAFLRLIKSIQNRKKITAEMIMINCKRLKCIAYLDI